MKSFDGDFEDFGAVAFAVAVLAAQIHVAQKLHLYMFKAGAAAAGTAAIAAVEAEFAGGVAALFRQACRGKQLANCVPSAHITDGVGAGGFADRGLVDKHHIAQMVGAQQTVVQARGFGGFAKVAEQGRRQHILNQARLAGTRHTGDADQALQRELHRDVLQVVLAHAFQNHARRAVGDHAFEAHAHLLSAAQIRTGHGVGQAQFVGGAVKHNVPALLPRARAHVDHTVSSQHDGRVVFDHHQRIAGIAQSVHGFGDAAHVARVQADARLVQHKQGVDQRSAQGRRQVDALHFAAAQGAALPVEREVTNAHIAQILQAGGDFFQQEFEGLRFAVGATRSQCGAGHAVKKSAQTVERHQHQIMQAESGQLFKLGAAPADTLGHETLGCGHHGIGVFQAADAPDQAVGFEAGATAIAAGRVAAVFGQEHPDVHLVGLGFQILEEALDAVPLLVPLAVPVGRALNHPMPLFFGQLVPRCVTRDAGHLGVSHHVVLAFFPGGGLDGFDHPGAQREFVVGNDQAIVHANDPPKTPAGLTRAQG